MEAINTVHQFSAVNADEQSTPPVINVATPEPQKITRNGKLPKIKHTANSFRPGKVAPANPSTPAEKPLELHFLMPASGVVGSFEEAGKVQQIVSRLISVEGVGSVTSFGLRSSTWEITLTLSKPASEVEDHNDFLSGVFQKLVPAIKNLPDLESGFSAGKTAKWKYMIGNFVAEEGGYE